MGRTPITDPARLSTLYAAALAVLSEVGFARFNYDRVADRAHVSKGKLYERWPSKVSLIADAVLSLRPDVPLPDSGCLSVDIREIMSSWSYDEAWYDSRGLLLGLLEASRDNDRMAELLEQHIKPAYAGALETVITRAVTRGELADTVDAATLASMLTWSYATHSTGRIVDGVLVPLLTSKQS